MVSLCRRQALEYIVQANASHVNVRSGEFRRRINSESKTQSRLFRFSYPKVYDSTISEWDTFLKSSFMNNKYPGIAKYHLAGGGNRLEGDGD